MQTRNPSKTSRQGNPAIKIEPPNHQGPLEINEVFQDLGYNSAVKEPASPETWELHLADKNDLERFSLEIAFRRTQKQAALNQLSKTENYAYQPICRLIETLCRNDRERGVVGEAATVVSTQKI